MCSERSAVRAASEADGEEREVLCCSDIGGVSIEIGRRQKIKNQKATKNKKRSFLFLRSARKT